MSISEKIKLNTHYTRSVNIERDANSLAVVSAYIPTSRAIRTMERLADAFGKKQAPRAWSLIGPYGSGKSSFSIYINHLLGNPEEESTRAAYNVLSKNKKLLNAFKKECEGTKGYFRIMISGAPESMSSRMVASMAHAAEDFWSRGKKPEIVRKLKNYASKQNIEPNRILELFKELQKSLRGKSKGIILSIDELGKFLEYEARHYGVNDIFLLQILAEHACRENDVNLFIFAMLHQSFEQYAKGLGDSLKKEWAKIQGRFEDVPFLEGPEQTLRIVSNAFKAELDKTEKDIISKNIKSIVNVLENENALPGVMSKSEAEKLFISCYPLHPLSALILPLLCQKIAQNERTLFSYLGSQEPFGLRQTLDSFESVGEFILPHHIFDYFITNQPASISDHITHRRWVEVVTAIERVGDVEPEVMHLLKTIGLLNIIGAQGGFKASKAILESVCKSKRIFKKYISELESKSVIQFRKFNSEYRVWQGSDFDIEQALSDELSNLGQFSLSEILNKRANLSPIVARRYTIDNGALRYFEPVFVDAKSFKQHPQCVNRARAIFYLSLGKDDEIVFENEVKGFYSDLDIVALYPNAQALREAVAEVEALDKVRINRQELNSDPVAQREFNDRIFAAEHAEQTLLRELVDSPQSAQWFHERDQLKVRNKREFQTRLSEVLNKVYSKAPIIHNELINRDKPSAQAVSARTKLLSAMLKNEQIENLGIEKNPPEKAIYNSIIKATGIHKQIAKGKWKLVEPELDGRKQRVVRIQYVWQEIKKFIESTEESPKSFAELDKTLIAPPYGVKAGLLPILYITAYLVYKDDIALYENRRYIPYMGEDHLERFIKRPDEFSIQYFKLTGLNKNIFEQYNKALFDDQGIKSSGEQRKLLELAKPLAQFIGNLPEYTQKTKRLSTRAIALRSAFQLSKSPVKLVFEDIPKALEIHSENESAELGQRLTECLRELKYAHSKMVDRQIELLANAFGIRKYENLAELRADIAGKVAGLESFTVDVDGVKAFLQRLTKKSGNAEDWLNNVLLFLGHKPTEKWSDSDQDQAEHRLNQFSRKVLDLHKLWVQYESHQKNIGDNFDVILLRSIKKGDGEQDAVITIDKSSKEVINSVKTELYKQLQNINDSELQLAALAEVVNEFLREYNSSQRESKETVTKKPAQSKGA